MKTSTTTNWKEFQKIVCDRMWVNLDLGRKGIRNPNFGPMPGSLSGDAKTLQRIAGAENQLDFLAALRNEIYWLINEKVITMDEAIRVGFDELSLLID
jgi:hypothetical protein